MEQSLDGGATEGECSSYFVEPMQWMSSGKCCGVGEMPDLRAALYCSFRFNHCPSETKARHTVFGEASRKRRSKFVLKRRYFQAAIMTWVRRFLPASFARRNLLNTGRSCVDPFLSASKPVPRGYLQTSMLRPFRFAVHEGELEGKILCSKCQSRLGSFNWSGEHLPRKTTWPDCMLVYGHLSWCPVLHAERLYMLMVVL